MSRRHQDGKPERPARDERKKATRSVRHNVAQQLHTVVDPEDATFSEQRVERSRRPVKSRRRLRHWKLKAWKRRTAARRQRNQVLGQLAAED